MRLVYIDEAGISRDEPFAVVAAVIIHADNQLVAFERNLDRLVEKWIPEADRDGFVFHATEIFNGTKKGVFRRGDPAWPLARRLALADDLAALPRNHRVTITCGFVDKSIFLQDPETRALFEASPAKNQAVAVHATAYAVCALRVDDWMRHHASNEICLLVVEDNTDARALIRETQTYHQDKRITLTLTEEHWKHLPLRNIKEDPLFQNKRPSSALQMADFCAYTFKKVLSGDHRYRRWVDPIRPQIYKAFDVQGF